MDSTLTAEDFERLGEAELSLSAGDRRLTATIAEVRRMATPETPERRDFSVLFRTADTDPVAQQIFRVEHPELGAHELFLVPLGPRGEAFDYEAVFT